jgi:type I restriction enzyme R subunit
VAKDIVGHFLSRGFQGKAMAVCIDKATALRMHDKVRAHWQLEQERIEQQLATARAQERTPEVLDQIQALNARLAAMLATDMALIVSPGQNEIEQMKKAGLDIAPHRKRMNDEALDEKFKDSDDPLRLVFVCAMWLTGFDAPSCSTVYLDKPMRNHTLMQTIARANRVFPGKHSGLVVDYANVFVSLEKALAIYGAGKGGAMPVRDKAKLLADLRKAVEDAAAFCKAHGVSIPDIENAAPGGMERLNLLAAAVEALISPDPLRKELLAHERLVITLYNAVKPDPGVVEFASRVACLATIAGTIRERLGEEVPDISAVMAGINRLLDDSIAADGFHIRPLVAEGDGRALIDISAIDFEALAKRFKKSNCKNLELEQLKAAIRAQLEKLIRLNKTRADYLTKFEELIESYNSGSRNIEDLFQQLLALTRALSDEQERHVRENLSEDELTVFDLLTRPGPELSAEERDQVKKVAKLLLERLNALLVLDWRRQNMSRAKVRLAIEDVLDDGLPRAYSPVAYQEKCAALFEHVFERFNAAA